MSDEKVLPENGFLKKKALTEINQDQSCLICVSYLCNSPKIVGFFFFSKLPVPKAAAAVRVQPHRLPHRAGGRHRHHRHPENTGRAA